MTAESFQKQDQDVAFAGYTTGHTRNERTIATAFLNRGYFVERVIWSSVTGPHSMLDIDPDTEDADTLVAYVGGWGVTYRAPGGEWEDLPERPGTNHSVNEVLAFVAMLPDVSAQP